MEGISILSEVSERLKSHVLSRQIYIKDYFGDFDPRNTKCITPINFRRVLSQIDLMVTNEEFDALCQEYGCVRRKQKMINYAPLCQDVNRVFAPRSISTKLEDPVVDQAQFFKSRTTKICNQIIGDISESDRSTIAQAIQRIRLRVHKFGLRIEPPFLNFDKCRTGSISPEQFHRALVGAGLNVIAQPPTLYLLLKVYPSIRLPGYVDYRRFLRDVAPTSTAYTSSDSMEKVSNNSKDGGEMTFHQVDIQVILTKLQCLLKKRVARVRDIFRGIDTLRKGRVSIHRFQSTLNSFLGASLSNAELEALTSRYGDYSARSAPLIRYDEFCQDLDLAGTSREGSQSLHVSPACEKVIDEFATWIEGRNPPLHSFLSDFDKVNSGLISTSQFRSALSSIGYTLPDERFFTLINDFLKADAIVDYRTFLRAVSSIRHRKFAVAQASDTPAILSPESVPRPIAAANPDTNETAAHKAMLRLKTFIHENSIRIEEFFRDYDKLRTGVVSFDVFTRILKYLGIETTALEVELLAQPYRFVNAEYPDHVHYDRFVEEINSVFTLPGLEQNPSAVPQSFEKYRIEIEDGNFMETPQQKQSTDALLKCIFSEIYGRSLDAKSPLKDFDKQNKGYTTVGNFSAALINIGLHLSIDEIEMLYLRYHRDAQRNISYRKFCEDYDSYAREQFEIAEKKRTVVVEPMQVHTVACESKISNSPHLVGKALLMVQTQYREKRTDLITYFRDYDTLRLGYVTANIFGRVLSSLGYNLSETDLVELLSTYECISAKGNVDYVKFCHHVDQALVPRAISNDAPTTTSYETFKEELIDPQTIEQEADTLLIDKLVLQMSAEVQRREIDLKTFFRSFDSNNNGLVIPHRAHSVLSNQVLTISNDKLHLLMKRFGRNAQFDYVKFCKVMDEMIHSSNTRIEQATSMQLESMIPTNQTLTINTNSHLTTTKVDVLNRLHRQCTYRHVRLYDILIDYDKMRTGLCLHVNLTRALDANGIQLSQSDSNALTTFYSMPHDKFAYRRMCHELDLYEAPLGIEKHPTRLVDQFERVSDVNAEYSTMDSTIKGIIERLARYGARHRYSPIEYLKSFDSLNQGIISVNRFMSLFPNVYHFHLDKELAGALSRRFAKGNGVDYRQFCQHIENYASKVKIN